MVCVMGIDIGFETSKGVVLAGGNPTAQHTIASGMNYRETAQRLRETLLAKAGLAPTEIAHTVATGHGAEILPFSHGRATDMHCVAEGIHHLFPSVGTVIDVQSQSSQVIQLDEKGRILDYAVSEVCASGSGGFITAIANVLQVALEDIGPLSLQSKHPIAFTTGCAVFGESEAVSRVAEGIPKEDILAGVHQALAAKLLALIDRVGRREPYAISGGGALNAGLIAGLEKLGLQLQIPPAPQLVNALGAARIAAAQTGSIKPLCSNLS